jgi:hypothetical protein
LFDGLHSLHSSSANKGEWIRHQPAIETYSCDVREKFFDLQKQETLKQINGNTPVVWNKGDGQ